LENPDVQQRPVTRERNVTTGSRRNSAGLERNDIAQRRSGTIHSGRETRQQVVRPATVNRTRSLESRPVQQRPASRTSSPRSNEGKRGRH
jgi:hypothetical protein